MIKCNGFIEINRAIAEIENIYPPNNLIACYKDFLKHRDYLHYYQYNEEVLVSLIDLTFKLWVSNERISRASLITITKRYFKKAVNKVDLSSQTVEKIFELFKEIVFYENLNLSKESVEITKRAINSILIGISLNENQLQWLCEHAESSGFVLNRILRYHLKSNVISNWAKKNFENDFARNRRAEITSWIIDINPDFKIEKETIEHDFEYQLAEDKKIVEYYKNEMDAYRLIEKELRPYLTPKDDVFYDSDGFEYKTKIQEKPVINLPRRYFNVLIKMNSGYGMDIPDFERIHQDYYANYDDYYNRIMAWSIAYSHLNVSKKTKLLNKYYTKSIYPTFFTIGKRLKSVEYFKWLKQMVNQQDY